MRIDIDGLSRDELIDLNHRIVERLRILDEVDAHKTMLEFSIGDRVMFVPYGGPPEFGVLTKYNRKTVTVVTDDKRRWNVAPTLLEHADVIDALTPANRILPYGKARGDL